MQKAGSNNYLCMASSNDVNGSSVSWKKWDGTDFTINTYDESSKTGGQNVAIANLNKVAGANPSVQWNEYLQEYVMVYYSLKTRHLLR